MSREQPDIGPRELQGNGKPGSPQCILAIHEWDNIQNDANHGTTLPTTPEAFRASLGPGALDNTDDFQPLIGCYRKIHTDCHKWLTTTFPNTVRLAGSIHQYGGDQAPARYEAIKQHAATLDEDPNNQQAKEQLKTLLHTLEEIARHYAEEAQRTFQAISEFSNNTEQRRIELEGADGKGGLKQKFIEYFGNTEDEVKEINAEVARHQSEIRSKEENWQQIHHRSENAAWYIWIVPVGTVAAAAVTMNGNSEKARLNREISALNARIKQLSAEKTAHLNFSMIAGKAAHGAHHTLKNIKTALPVIEKIQGTWKAIADDLTIIRTTIDTNIRKVPPMIMNLGVDSTIQKWQTVAKASDAYRKSAFIKTMAPHQSNQVLAGKST